MPIPPKYAEIAQKARQAAEEMAFASMKEARVKLEEGLKESVVLGLEPNVAFGLGCLSVICTRLADLGEAHVPHPVQLAAAAALYDGTVIHMENGEGKTLTAALAAALRAKTGAQVHVSTQNDYLVRRDATWMWPIYQALGLEVGTREQATESGFRVTGQGFHEVEPVSAQTAYGADVLYAHRKRLGYDYLSDHHVAQPRDRMQRSLDFVLIDEVDTTLIDDAREFLQSTSSRMRVAVPADQIEEVYRRAWEAASRLKPSEHFVFDYRERPVVNDAGLEALREYLQADPYRDPHVLWIKYVRICLRALHRFHAQQHYLVHSPGISVIEAKTGRPNPTLRYSEGIHQALLIKENLPFEPERQTTGRISIQHYYKQYNTIAGMSGSVWPIRKEIRDVYGLNVERFPTQLPSRRIDEEVLILKTMRERDAAAVNDAIYYANQGRPVLVGVETPDDAAKLKGDFKSFGIEPLVLSATEHRQEAEKIQQLGEGGVIMISAKMAGRGTDIKLTPEALEKGGLHVIIVGAREERAELQLRGRAGRRGQPGSSSCIASPDDPLMQAFSPERMKRYMATLRVGEGEVITHPFVTASLNLSRRRMRQNNFLHRAGMYEADTVIDEFRAFTYSLRREIVAGEADVADLLLRFSRNMIYRAFDRGRREPGRSLDLATQQVISSLRQDMPAIEINAFANVGKVRGWLPRADALSKRFQQLVTSQIKVLQETMYGEKGWRDRLMADCLRDAIDEAWAGFIESSDELYNRAQRRNIGQAWMGGWFRERAHDRFMSTLEAVEKKALARWSQLANASPEELRTTLFMTLKADGRLSEAADLKQRIGQEAERIEHYGAAADSYFEASLLFGQAGLSGKQGSTLERALAAALQHLDRSKWVEIGISALWFTAFHHNLHGYRRLQEMLAKPDDTLGDFAAYYGRKVWPEQAEEDDPVAAATTPWYTPAEQTPLAPAPPLRPAAGDWKRDRLQQFLDDHDLKGAVQWILTAWPVLTATNETHDLADLLAEVHLALIKRPLAKWQGKPLARWISHRFQDAQDASELERLIRPLPLEKSGEAPGTARSENGKADLEDVLIKEARNRYESKQSKIAGFVYDALVEKTSADLPEIPERVSYNFSDGDRIVRVVVPITEALESKGAKLNAALEREVWQLAAEMHWDDWVRAIRTAQESDGAYRGLTDGMSSPDQLVDLLSDRAIPFLFKAAPVAPANQRGG